jgi:hypothetical protein
MHMISSIMMSNANAPMMAPYPSGHWNEEAMILKSGMVQDILELHLFISNASMKRQQRQTYERTLASLILRYPVPAGAAYYSAAGSVSLRLADVRKELALFGNDNENSIYVKSDFTVRKERDLLSRFGKQHPDFSSRPGFAKEFEQQILGQICREIEHLNITTDDGDDLEQIRPDL